MMNSSQLLSPDCLNNNNGTSSMMMASSPPVTVRSKIPQPRPIKILACSKESSPLGETVSSPRTPASGLMSPRGPLSRAGSREDVQGGWGQAGQYAERWKQRFQETDRKYKNLLVKGEKTLRDHNDLERRYHLLRERNDLIEAQLAEKEMKLGKLRAVSEKVYKEYDQLKNQYDVETQAMHKAMQTAGQWYQQNRRLKRRSAALMQRLPPQELLDWDNQDSTDAASESSGGEELEGLRETVADLSREVARLQTEISSVKLQEFEATELNVNLTQELEVEKAQRAELEARLHISLEESERNKRLARHLATEVAAFREQLEHTKWQATQMKSEVESARKERDVLAHRSSLYIENFPDLGDLLGSPVRPMSTHGDLLQGQQGLLQELEALRVQLEEERVRHSREMDDLHEKLIDRETDNEMFILSEKLKLAEEDARNAKERAEKAEQRLEELHTNRKSVMRHVSTYENAQKSSKADESKISVEEVKVGPSIEPCGMPVNVPPPPPPPIPPPPPLPVLPNGKASSVDSGKTNSSAIADMANLLGLKQASNVKRKPSGGAIDDIINQIKGGRFHLKSTEQKTAPKKPREEPAALKEMLNILGTLRRRPKKDKNPTDEENKEIIV